jgi:membrane protease YdiL (CAAX protease family)
MINRVTQFLRSVLPADPFQLCFLAGLVCLTIAPHLRWWPVEERADWSAKLNGSLVPMGYYMGYYVVQVMATCGLILASSAGYFFCFWPGKRTKAKVWLSVVLPAAVSIALTSVAFLNIRRGEYSVLTQIHGSGKGLSWVVTELWHQGSGIHFAALGIGLTALFGLRLIRGTSDLPLELSRSSDIGEWPQEESKGNARLIWFSVAPSSSVIMAVVGFGLLAPLRLTSAYRGPKAWMGFLQAFVVAAVMLVLSMWLAGSENRKLVYGLVRRLNPKLILIGAALPALVSLSPPIVRFIVDRVSWAANDFGKYSPPHLLSYLPVPEIWTLSLVFAAFVEEIVFRGVLQRHFVIRHGVPRGIFLVGIVWASFHFFTDKYATSDQGVVLDLLLRVAQCVILGFALSWLTLRSSSLLPATMAHWLSNVGVYSARDPDYPGRGWMNPLLWLLVALVLFRFWPVEDTDLTAQLAESVDT